MDPPLHSAPGAAQVSVPHHRFDYPLNSVLVDVQGIFLCDAVVAAVQVVRRAGNLPKSLLIDVLTGGHDKELDPHVSRPLSLHLHSPTGTASDVAISDDYRKLHITGRLALELLCHVGDSTVREGAPAKVLNSTQLGEVYVFASC